MTPAVRAVLALGIVAGVVSAALLLKRANSGAEKSPAQPAPSALCAAANRPRFVDLGTETCAPCRTMLGVVKELEQRYPATLDVEFINIQRRPEVGEKYGIKVIPTQIFFSPDGRELFRNVGVLPADRVASKWKELGYDLATCAAPIAPGG